MLIVSIDFLIIVWYNKATTLFPEYFRVYYALLRTILLSVAIYSIAIIIVLNDYSGIVW